MKTQIFATLAAVVLAASAVSSATVASAQDLTPATEVTPITAIITAPDAVLTNDAPTVSTAPAPVEVPTPEPTFTAPEPAPVAPIAPAPVQTPATTPEAPEAAPEEVTPAPITEDSPEWDCATMGNLICGTNEAQALFLSSAPTPTDSSKFEGLYVGIMPSGEIAPLNTRSVSSVINPAYKYVFTLEAPAPCESVYCTA